MSVGKFSVQKLLISIIHGCVCYTIPVYKYVHVLPCLCALDFAHKCVCFFLSFFLQILDLFCLYNVLQMKLLDQFLTHW